MGEKTRLEYDMLTIIEQASEPVGSGTIARELSRAGYAVSDATAGRLLRDLDAMGYTERAGFRGRRLTAAGIRRMKDLEYELQRISYSNALVMTLKPNDRHELIDVLVARKAVEGETARLAAMNASKQQIQELAAIISSHQERSARGITADDDSRFHHLIAEASGNKILTAVVDLMRHDGQFTPVLEFIRTRVGSKVADDHTVIYQRIASGDPEGARQAMVGHLDSVIADVNKYWSVAGNGAPKP